MVLVAFLVSLVLVAAATAYAVLNGIRFFREAKTTGRTLGAELARFDERSARAERLLAEADAASLRLQAAVERLRISRARLQVLTGSLEAAQRRTRWLRVFMPPR